MSLEIAVCRVEQILADLQREIGGISPTEVNDRLIDIGFAALNADDEIERHTNSTEADEARIRVDRCLCDAEATVDSHDERRMLEIHLASRVRAAGKRRRDWL
ncbi:MAG: hypothetical protein KKF85_17075 [Gammaproteobacteria bacterium]|nr:hypothetical protein [Rhodocyclaceae bacterium]MBU3910908.1 hypothetical protein [Gammaproteobacteria bacterium]MBU3988146.1 hypothetical protein [Gammaproteobacteria bacterium]MBU4006362.1 hypothetical protein [Gammaproteobacteria bacterium]MBU4097969.1 hypothetical protein [Gammaproteobacteria bacterium]